MSIFIVYGFDTAGTFGEETVDASRQAPRGVLSSILISGAVGVVFLLAVILSLQDIPATMEEGLAGGFPIATTITSNLTTELVGGITRRRDLPVRHPRVRLRVHAGDPGRGDPDDVLDGPRPAPAARRRLGSASTTRFKTPANAAIAVGVLAAIPILVDGPIGGIVALDRRDRADLPHLLPVQPRRR